MNHPPNPGAAAAAGWHQLHHELHHVGMRSCGGKGRGGGSSSQSDQTTSVSKHPGSGREYRRQETPADTAQLHAFGGVCGLHDAPPSPQSRRVTCGPAIRLLLLPARMQNRFRPSLASHHWQAITGRPSLAGHHWRTATKGFVGAASSPAAASACDCMVASLMRRCSSWILQTPRQTLVQTRSASVQILHPGL